MRYFIYILIIALAFNGCGTTGGLNLDEGVEDKSKYKSSLLNFSLLAKYITSKTLLVVTDG